MLAYASPRVLGYATINVSAPPLHPTNLPTGIASIMIYGSNALPSRQLANHPTPKRGNHALTAATFTTTCKTAQPTLFVPLVPWVALVDASFPSFQPLRGTITPAMHQKKNPVATLDAPPLRFSCRNFNMGACYRQTCPFRYVCAKCGDSAHRERHCPTPR